MVGLEKFPDSACTPGTAEWIVEVDDFGVNAIFLNDYAIWPGSQYYEDMMNPATYLDPVEGDTGNAQKIATAFNVAFADGLITEYGTYTSIPSGVYGFRKLPDSFCTPGSADWSIILDEDGVYKITLNGFEIWPDKSDYVNAMTK